MQYISMMKGNEKMKSLSRILMTLGFTITTISMSVLLMINIVQYKPPLVNNLIHTGFLMIIVALLIGKVCGLDWFHLMYNDFEIGYSCKDIRIKNLIVIESKVILIAFAIAVWELILLLKTLLIIGYLYKLMLFFN